jgi:deoxyxylulose-5-phosphate synthase
VGGFGAAVLEAIEEARLADPAFRDVVVRVIGIPADRFVDHGSVGDLRRTIRLDVPGITAQVREAIEAMQAQPAGVSVGPDRGSGGSTGQADG